MSNQLRDPAALRPQPKPDPCHLWPTPPCLIEALTAHVLPYLPQAPLWECAAGDGRVAVALRAAGYTVFASDIAPRGDGIECRDFLRDQPPQPGELIAVTNSPFGKHLTLFIARGLQLLDRGRIAGLVLLVRHDALMAKTRVAALNRAAMVLACNWRPVWIEGSRGNPRWACSWIVWLPNYMGPTAVRWVLPERSQRQATLPLAHSERPRFRREKVRAAQTAPHNRCRNTQQ